MYSIHISRMLRLLTSVVLIVTAITAEQCLPGSFHKKASSPATKPEDYAECKAYNADTCCTANFTQTLHKTRVRELYGFHWGHCKNVSKECDKFLIEEECFYSCEPRLIRWQVKGISIKNVPVCGSYCNRWFEACKDDETCFEDWLADVNYDNNTNTCPKNSTCRTFKEMYGNGEGLCNKMWGSSFRYVNDSCPCTTFDKPMPQNVDVNSEWMGVCSGSSKVVAFFVFYLCYFFIAINLG